MSEMLQRVADVITAHANPDHDGAIEGEYAISLARHVIEAMREPTQPMDLAAVEAESYRSLGLLKTRRIWKSMIDAALQERCSCGMRLGHMGACSSGPVHGPPAPH